jgi:hypothetical protein
MEELRFCTGFPLSAIYNPTPPSHQALYRHRHYKLLLQLVEIRSRQAVIHYSDSSSLPHHQSFDSWSFQQVRTWLTPINTYAWLIQTPERVAKLHLRVHTCLSQSHVAGPRDPPTRLQHHRSPRLCVRSRCATSWCATSRD